MSEVPLFPTQRSFGSGVKNKHVGKNRQKFSKGEVGGCCRWVGTHPPSSVGAKMATKKTSKQYSRIHFDFRGGRCWWVGVVGGWLFFLTTVEPRDA